MCLSQSDSSENEGSTEQLYAPDPSLGLKGMGKAMNSNHMVAGFLSFESLVDEVRTLPGNDHSALTHTSSSFPSRCSSAFATLQAASQRLIAASWTKAMAANWKSAADAKSVRTRDV